MILLSECILELHLRLHSLNCSNIRYLNLYSNLFNQASQNNANKAMFKDYTNDSENVNSDKNEYYVGDVAKITSDNCDIHNNEEATSNTNNINNQGLATITEDVVMNATSHIISADIEGREND